MTFTEPEPSQVDRVVALMREFYASEQIAFDERSARASFSKLLATPALGVIRIISEGETVAGYFVLTFGFSFEFGGRLAWIDELYVRREFRRRGIGRQVLATAEDMCRAEGISALRLEVNRENVTAERLYRGFGFEDPHRDVLTLRIR